MKRILLFITFAFITLSIGCSEKGTGYTILSGYENTLPPELKGLKVYEITIDNRGNTIRVAILNDNVNSVTTTGKNPKTTIMVDVSKEKIVYENDSVIIIKK